MEEIAMSRQHHLAVRFLPLVAVITLAPPVPVLAQQSASSASETVFTEPAAIVTPDARAVLDRMQAYLNSLQTFQIDARSSRDEVLAYGYKLQNNETARMIVQRPNRMRVDVDGDIKHRSYYYDGATLTMFAPDDGVYAQTEAPDSIAKVVNGLLNAGVEMPLIDVLYQAAHGSLLDGVRFGLRVGDTAVDGVMTDHLAFRQANIDWQLWVAKNGQPRRILITTRYEVGDPQYQVSLDWNAKPKINAATFKFTPPDGAQKIPFYVPGVSPAAAGQP